MATFKALNIESDDDTDDEIDNTKEIQIEDALKVYQTALKFHAQGRSSLREAGEAYENLFESEIFKYAESQSEYSRVEAYEEALERGIELPLAVESTNAQQTTGGVDNGPNALPQILHLSYKNRGQYYLDALEKKLDDCFTSGSQEDSQKTSEYVREAATLALEDFSEALDKDEEDLDLWRRTAKISHVLDSKRISRYCLEAALETDLEGTDDVLGFANVEVKVASRELRKLETILHDDLTLLQSSMPETKSSPAPLFLEKQLEIYPFLPLPAPITGVSGTAVEDSEPDAYILNISESSWKALGAAILDRYTQEQAGLFDKGEEKVCRLVLKISDEGPTQVPTWHAENDESGGVDENSLPKDDNVEQKPETSPPVDSINSEDKTGIKSETANLAIVEPGEPGVAKALEAAPLKTILPSRKRSMEAADPLDAAEGPRGRSKRTRVRPSIMGEGDLSGATNVDMHNHVEKSIENCIQTDTWLFDTLDVLAQRLGINTFHDASKLRTLISPEQSRQNEVEIVATGLLPPMRSFYSAMQSWNDQKTLVLTRENIEDEQTDLARNASLMSYLLQSGQRKSSDSDDLLDRELSSFIHLINTETRNIQEVAISFIVATLSQTGVAKRNPVDDQTLHLYSTSMISSELQKALEELVLRFDDALYNALKKNVEISHDYSVSEHKTQLADHVSMMQIIQCLFELHLELFASQAQPGNTTSEETLGAHRNRVEKWCYLSREALNLLPDHVQEENLVKAFQLRHMWASILQLRYSDDVSRDHVIRCLREIRDLFIGAGDIVIELPNNATMPVLSSEAASREISKLETMDFFLSIFQKDNNDPYDLVDRLEPIMIMTLPHDGQTGLCTDLSGPTNDTNRTTNVPSSVQVLVSFLTNAKTSLRLSLWQRLQEAWEALKHPPKVFSICLRRIDLIITDMKSITQRDKPTDSNEEIVLKNLRQLDSLLTKAFHITEDSTDPFECMDYEHFQSSTRAVTDLTILLYTVSLYDDYSQVGQKGPLLANPFRSYPSESFHQAAIKFHDMQIRAYILLYKFFCEAMIRQPEDFPAPAEDRLAYLRHVHYTLGVRRLCKASDGFYLKFMEGELLVLNEVHNAQSDDFAQIMYDLYDLWFFSDAWAKFDHGCEPDYLDRETALGLIDVTMEKVKTFSMKELMKSELGKSVERIHTALGHKKGSLATVRNRKMHSAYLKSAINPLELLRCTEGIGGLNTLPVNPEESIIASKGWFFLKGQMSFLKYKSQVRKVPGSMDDLQTAITFFNQDVEYNAEAWESWYRIAQAYDAMLEEQVVWSAEKINSQRGELNQLQRSAIHAYTMATAAAVRSADNSPTTLTKLSEMYADFGSRIYSSTRQPFSMEAFSLDDYGDKPTFGANETALRMRKQFRALGMVEALKFALVLFRRSLVHRPQHWQTYFMLGNCLWKIFNVTDKHSGGDYSKRAEQIISVFQKAVEHTPPRKDPNRQDPVLEPINKLVSIVHKMRMSLDIEDDVAGDAIDKMFRKQRQFDVPNLPDLNTHDSWWTYILEVFKILRNADKAKWHHRPVFTTAHIIYEMIDAAGGKPREAAQAAKECLVQRGAYSAKTLSLNVWKPDRERPGRHHVYVTRYSQFLVQLFEDTEDWEALSVIAKRIRKKTDMYFEHTKLWEDVCGALLRVLRRHCNIPEHYEENVFRAMTQEEFAPRAALIDVWTVAANTKHPLNDVLREVSELKKLNSGLAKTSAIDDLIADVFAMIWTTIGPSLEPPRPVASLPTQSIVLTTPQTQPPPQQRDEKMSLMHLMNLDGAADRRSTPASTPPVTPMASFVTSNGLQSGEPAVSAKPRIVLRRQIIKRATDAASTKPATSTTANATPLKSLPRPRDPNFRVVIPARRSSGAGSPDTPGPTTENEPAPASPAPSDADSGHDSADNESEPSDAGDGDDEMGDADEDTEMEDGDAEADADVDVDADVDADGDADADLDPDPDGAIETSVDGQRDGDVENVARKPQEVVNTTPIQSDSAGNDQKAHASDTQVQERSSKSEV